MKKLILTLIVAAGAISSYGQGQITLQNSSSTLVTFASSGASVTLADSLTAVLWFSATQPADLGSMTPIASTAVGQISGTAVAGRFGGGVITTPNSIAPGDDAWFAVSVQGNFVDLNNLGSQMGSSGPFLRPTGAGGIAQPTNLYTATTGYGQLGAIAVVPEPSVLALALAGAGVLIFRRKR